MNLIKKSEQIQNIIYLSINNINEKEKQLKYLKILSNRKSFNNEDMPKSYHQIFIDEFEKYDNFIQMLEYARPKSNDTIIFYSIDNILNHLRNYYDNVTQKLNELHRQGFNITFMLEGLFFKFNSNANETFLFQTILTTREFCLNRMKLIIK